MFGCHWFCHVLSIFWAGWVVVPNGIPLGSLLEVFPALHSSFLCLPSSFQQEACLYVWLSLVLSCFVHFLGWLGGCVSCLFCFQGFRACRIPNTPRIISNLGEISRNGIPLGSLLEMFPALHSSFLFLPSSFQQEACVYVWLSLVLSCFVHFLGWLGGCVSCLFCFQGFRACRIPREQFQTSGKSLGMAFHWALSWKCSQPCILPFYFFHLLFSKKHVCMFGCHWFCHVLSIFWAGWVVVPNGIPLGSFLEAFPAWHSSFLFLPSSFQQEACIYVLSAVVCGTLRGKWLIYLIEVNAQIILKFVGFGMRWYTYINVLVTLDANHYTQCADLFLRNHQEKSERLRKIPKLFDVV